MDLTHRFTVPASVEDTWAAFTDIESVAGCFPGATVTSVEGDEFKGSCKVKLGPIALVYNGSGTFVERDESAHRFVVEAKGKDKRGNGTAGATVTATLTSSSPGATDVEVATDLAITGKPAQFGRGVIQDVSDKLLQQFVDCLEAKVAAPTQAADTVTSEASAQGAGTGTAEVSGAAASGATSSVDAGRHAAPVADTTSTIGPAGSGAADALDLGATVLPALAKAYWKPVAGVLVALLVLRWLLGGRGR